MEKKYLDYNESNSWERLKHTLKSWKYIGVGKSLLIWFLAISFVPLVSVGYINYLKAYQGLTIVADKSLKSSSQLRLKYLTTYFEEVSDLMDITVNSEAQKIYFNNLLSKFQNSGSSAKEFVNSNLWNEYTIKERKDFKNALKKKDFYNFLFISLEGDVIFSVKNEKLSGSNVFNEPILKTKLSKTILKAIENNKPYFSDLEIFEPSFGIISGFFVSPITDVNNETIGLIAVQITVTEINNMLQQEAGYGETGQAYIVGKDLYLRSTMKYGDETEVLTTRIVNDKTKLWKDYLIHESDPVYLIEHELKDEGGTNYDTDGKGKYVLGIYRNIDYLTQFGVNWALIEEIEHDEAFANARELSDIVKISFLITILIVLLISVLVTRWFVNPIKQLSSWGKQVAIGELNLKTIRAPKNEIGDMSDTFNKLVSSLQSYANVAKSMAKGDFTEKVEIRSKNDVLGKSMNQMVESFVSVVDQANTIAKGDFSATIEPRSENDSLGNALFDMTEKLRENSTEIKRQDWLKTGYNRLGNTMTGNIDLESLTDKTLSFFCNYIDAQIGVLFIKKDENHMHAIATYALSNEDKNINKPIKKGEGLVGQVFKDEKAIIVNNKAGEGLPLINYGTVKKQAGSYIIQPIMHETDIVGIILFGTLIEPDEVQNEFIIQSLQDVAIAIKTIQSHIRVKELLNRTQEQANELEVQQEELKQSNEELQEQTKALKISEENLQSQKEELKVTNEELEERSKALEIQRDAIKQKNKELEIARQEIEIKAKHIAQASQYKSEFLANMSHELRTPLNSIIVLSQLLSENKKIHLDKKELQFAQTINSSGNDLLDLINDILDLSKVESGKIELNIERLYFADLLHYVKGSFKPILDEKKIDLKFNFNLGKIEYIETDVQRVQQIIKNLFSNAAKFTTKGSITLEVSRPPKSYKFSRPELNSNNSILISVLDTGIGIPKEKQDIIFEAFKQADGTTSRKYGGTGLGLSISRNFATLLGGEMELQSDEKTGSKFTLALPLELIVEDETILRREIPKDGIVIKDAKVEEAISKPKKPVKKMPHINDDRDNILKTDKLILIIEDDYNFASVLLSLAHEHGFKGIIALDGETGIYLADYHAPKAIILDIGLPGMDGYQVMEQLKINGKTRHIPVHFISAADRNIDAFKMGAIGYLTKPAKKEQIELVFSKIESLIAKPVKRLLIVEDEAIMRKSIVELMKGDNISITELEKGKDAIELVKKENFDCMILDLGLEDITGFELLEELKNQKLASDLPIVIYTGKELTKKETIELQKYSQSIILKGAHSFERLLAETTLFLHQVESNLPSEQRKMLESVHGKENILDGKTILVVDDDMRNVFALSSLLESHNAKVIVGKNGKEGISQLKKHNNIDLILMDIMMPEMDGYEAMRLIRKEKRWKSLPIIALTAKAMKEDREKCLAAGANEYLSKPVEKDKLISLLRVWLYK